MPPKEGTLRVTLSDHLWGGLSHIISRYAVKDLVGLVTMSGDSNRLSSSSEELGSQ